MKFSIITIVFNDPEGLEETLLSIKDQTYKNFEVIVVDGSSKPDTIDVLDKYSSVVTTLIREPDDGIYDAMNKGIGSCSGDYFCFMNAGDCFYSSSVLSEINDCVINRPYTVFGKSLTIYKDLEVLRYSNFDSNRSDFYYSKLPNHQAVFLSLKKFGNLRYNLEYRFCADTEYLYKVFKEGNYQEYNGIVSVFELGGASNYYRNFSDFFCLTKESYRLRKNFKVVLSHCIKFCLQRIMGKDRYLKWYVKHGVKR